MTDIIKITDHETRALKRRMEQWKNKPNMESALKALVGGYPDLEEMFFDLLDKRIDITAAEGEQLDQIGEIVGQKRLNFDDAFYRILLWVRIGINVSEGEPERIISTFKILTQGVFVHYMNLFDGEVMLGTDGTVDVVTVDFLIENMEKVLMGGVRLNRIVVYENAEAFAFAGNNASAIAKGFGTVLDANIGGKLAKMHTRKPAFAFAGNDESAKGFGTIRDPLIGGVLQKL